MQAFLSDKGYEAISAMQKAIRRADEEQALFWFYQLESLGGAVWALSRIRVTAFEDIGVADPQAVMFAVVCLDQAAEWYKQKKGSYRLAVANAIMALSRAVKSREADHFQAAIRGRFMASGGRAEVPDYALDKHTRRGKMKKRGIEHFREEGAKLIPQPPKDKYEDEAYEFWAKAGGEEAGIESETPSVEGYLFQ